jgi:hypothetical protein
MISSILWRIISFALQPFQIGGRVPLPGSGRAPKKVFKRFNFRDSQFRDWILFFGRAKKSIDKKKDENELCKK